MRYFCIRYADAAVETAPAEEGPMECKILCFGLDEDKTNDSGA